jgi:hypothetical protein
MQDSIYRLRTPLRYFFCITRNGIRTDQSDGLEFTDQAAAWREAAASCGEIIREIGSGIEPGCLWQLEVSDDRGTPIYRFSFTAEEV